jgi:hypothetical protein
MSYECNACKGQLVSLGDPTKQDLIAIRNKTIDEMIEFSRLMLISHRRGRYFSDFFCKHMATLKGDRNASEIKTSIQEDVRTPQARQDFEEHA